MDSEQSVGDVSRDDLRKKIVETREALGDKVEDLEERMHHLSGSVKGRVEEVKKQLNVRYQIEHRPFAWVGVSFLSGLLVGAVSGRRIEYLSGVRLQPRAEVRPQISGDQENAMVRKTASFVQNLFRRALSDAVPLLVQAGGAYILGMSDRKGRR